MKNKILVTFMALCLVGTTPIAAQSKEASENNEVSDTYGHHEIADSLEQPAPGSNDYLRKTNKVFVVVEKMPSFPDPKAMMEHKMSPLQDAIALMEFIQNNIQYPEEAIKNNESGRVVVNFVVEKDGSISNERIVRSVSPSLDKEALRIVSSMPKWNPGKQNGIPVRVRYEIPIGFRQTVRDSSRIYDAVEQMPSFPKGNSALMEYIQNNILYLYAEEAIKNNESGRVIVSFVIEKDGSTTNGKVVRSVSPSLDKEALRIIDFMPSWNPGKQKGVPVRVKYTLPIDFKL